MDDETLYLNGKLKVGYIYTLEKINMDIHVNQNQ